VVEEEEEEEEEGTKYIPFYRFNFVVVHIVAQCEVTRLSIRKNISDIR
jgi:hypothetical protein